MELTGWATALGNPVRSSGDINFWPDGVSNPALTLQNAPGANSTLIIAAQPAFNNGGNLLAQVNISLGVGSGGGPTATFPLSVDGAGGIVIGGVGDGLYVSLGSPEVLSVFTGGGATNFYVGVPPAGSFGATNTIKLVAPNSNNAVTIGVGPGSSTNVSVNLISKGTGTVQINGVAAMTNPMTTAGDLIIGGTAGAATRLAATTNGWVLTLVAGAPAWAAASGGGVSWPLTATTDQGFQPDSIANNALNLQNATLAANGLNIQGKAAGSAPVLSVVSSGTNEGLAITPKGTGTTTITAGGLTITAGGLAVTAGGLTVGGGTVNPVNTVLGNIVKEPQGYNVATALGASNLTADAAHSHGTMLDPTNTGIVYGADPLTTVNTASAWPAANVAIYVRCNGGLSVTNMIFFVATSSGNYDVGFYTESGAGVAALPATRIASKGTTAMPAAGLVTAAVGSVNTILQGTDYMALAVDNLTAVIGNVQSNSNVLPGFASSMSASFPLPASFGTAGSRSTVPLLFTS